MPEQEAHEWVVVRNAAISAVEEAAADAAVDGLVPGGAAILADAVLAVCHEEAVNRMADQFVGETRVRNIIAETYAGEGLPPSACTRAAHSYHVWLVAGPLDHDVAWDARRAWDNENYEPAMELARPRVRRSWHGKGGQ